MKKLSKAKRNCFICMISCISISIAVIILSCIYGINFFKSGNFSNVIVLVIICLITVVFTLMLLNFCIEYIDMIICFLIPKQFIEVPKKSSKKNANISKVFARNENASFENIEIYIKFNNGSKSSPKKYKLKEAKKIIDFYAL